MKNALSIIVIIDLLYHNKMYRNRLTRKIHKEGFDMLDIITKKKIKNNIEMILHSPGNYNGGILEMAIVFDCSMDKERIVEMTKDLVDTLKRTNDVFRNVRLNTLLYKRENEIICDVSSLAMLQLGKFFDCYEKIEESKDLMYITEKLKKFYARSKLIIMITDGDYKMENKEMLKNNLEPFLRHKLLIITNNGTVRGTEIWRQCIL